MSLPTIDEFLTWTFPCNSYVDHPGFESLYVRSSKVHIHLEGQAYWCEPVLQIGSVDATDPGNGAFTALVEFLVERDLAVYVENVHNTRFQRKLRDDMGFTSVNEGIGVPNFLFNFECKLKKSKP